MRPRILILYYSFTNQTHRVAQAMGERFKELQCHVELCKIEIDDPRYRIEMPFWPIFSKLLFWCIPQLLGYRCKIRFDQKILEADFDLICIGSPTWWFHPAMPVSSFLKTSAAGQLMRSKRFAVFAVCRKLWWNNLRIVKKLAGKSGGIFVDSAAFAFKGNELQTALTCLSYFKTGRNQQKVWGFKVYEFGIPSEGLDRARDFASGIVKENFSE